VAASLPLAKVLDALAEKKLVWWDKDKSKDVTLREKQWLVLIFI
jgi:hypothetical protein